MELSKKERRELKREKRKQIELSQGRKKSVKFWVICGAIFLAIAIGVYFGYQYISKKASIGEIGNSFSIEGDKHVSDGTKIEYHTNPPASGSHYAIPANWGVYDHEIPDEAAVHNLEHGGIWIIYKPEIDAAIKAKLEEITKSNSKIIMTPRAKNDSPISLVSWGRVHKMTNLNEEEINNFILKYKNTGPEKVPDSMSGKDY